MKKIGSLFGSDFYIDSEEEKYVKSAIKWFKKMEAREDSINGLKEELVKKIEKFEAPMDQKGNYDLESLHEGYFKAIEDIISLIKEI